jgi:hypothetical protein
MMKPDFDDLIEYVRAGEIDPEMQELLDHNPDGQELLKQARFICKVLRDRYGESGDIGATADADTAWGTLGEVAAMNLENLEDAGARTFYQSAPFRQPRRRRPTHIDTLLAHIESDRQKLGTLTFAVDEQRVSVSYQPSEVVASYAQKFPGKVPTLQLGLLGIQIRSIDLNISLPESLAAGDPITLRLSRSHRQRPARYLDLIFMPETGPFVRILSDEEGDAELPAPIQSGNLRIETDEPRFLQIKVEKS